jgi:hypothetical protein
VTEFVANVVGVAWIGAVFYWVWAHILFYRALKEQEPELATKFGVLGLGFMPFVDVALRNLHERSTSDSVRRSGARIAKLYEWRSRVLGSIFRLAPLLLLAGVIWYAYKT